MITFFRLKVEGYKSISELDISLNTKIITLIRGANGNGKSSILDALGWVIYGKSIKGVSDVKTLPQFWGEKAYSGVKGEIYFQKDDEVYRIIRCSNYKNKLEDGVVGGNRLIVAKDGDPIDIKGKPQIQAYIENKLGMSYTLFINSILFGQGLTRLIQESNTDKKKIFVDAFNLQFIDRAKDLANSKYKECQSDYKDFLRKKESLNEVIENLQDTYDRLLKSKRDYNTHTRNEIHSYQERISGLEKRLEGLKSNDYRDTSKEVSAKTKKLKDLRSQLSQNRKLSNVSLEDFVIKLYKLWEAKKFKDLGKSLKDLYTVLKTNSKLETKIENLSDEIDDLITIRDRYNANMRAISSCNESISSLKDKIRLIKDGSSKKFNIKPIKSDLVKKKSELEKLVEDNQDLLELKENYEWLINDPLSNSGIKAYLFDSCLEKLNSVLDSFSSLLGFRILFFIDLNTTRKEFDTVIEKDGEKLLYEELSGGEKQLVNVAIAFAMNLALTESRGLNLMFLDEVFESLDKDNIEVVINLIENTFQDKTLFLISHQDSLPIHNSKTIYVEKIQGRSYYKVL